MWIVDYKSISHLKPLDFFKHRATIEQKFYFSKAVLMSNQIISTPVIVELQGQEPLLHIGTYNEFCLYNLNGFSQIKVEVEDHRVDANLSLKAFLKFGDPKLFLDTFCSPAHLILEEKENGDLKIILSETDSREPDMCLWMVTGIGRRIPVYPYKFIQSNSIDKDHFALVAVYHHTVTEQSSDLFDHFSPAHRVDIQLA